MPDTFNRIKVLRKRRGELTQEELATLVGVTQGYLSKIETDVVALDDPELIARMCKALRCKPHELWVREPATVTNGEAV